MPRSMPLKTYSGRCSTFLDLIGGHGGGNRRLSPRRAVAPTQGGVHAARAGERTKPQVRALLARGPVRPALVATAAAEPRFQCDQIYPEWTRARRLPAPRRRTAHRRLRYRPRHSGVKEAGNLSGISPARTGGQGGAWLGTGAFDRGADRTRSRTQDYGQLVGRSRIAVLRRGPAFGRDTAEATAPRGTGG